jgi:hypothetical protein
MRNENLYKNKLFKSSRIKNVFGHDKAESITLNNTSYKKDEKDLSFIYDPPGTPLRSTQQLNLDWSKFENHTFFNSARNKTQVAFYKIINNFPFDGTFNDVEKFLSTLSGFERFVFDNFPKYNGFLSFDHANNNHLSIKRYKNIGELETELIHNVDGSPALDISNSPFTFEMELHLPQINNDNMIIFQQLQNDHNSGIMLAVSSSNDPETAKLVFALGNIENGLVLSQSVPKGEFFHIAIQYDKYLTNNINFLFNGTDYFKSEKTLSDVEFNFGYENFIIGSGSNFQIQDYQFNTKHTLTGSLNEFRLFKKYRTQDEIFRDKDGPVFKSDSLELYFRFDEPYGLFDYENFNEDLVLDYSGNRLHTRVNNFTMNLRNKELVSDNVDKEYYRYSPILFSNFYSVLNLNKKMILDAEQYDNNNPNLVTKLVPKHYLTEAAYYEGIKHLNSSYEEISESTEKNYISKDGNIEKTHVFASVLFLWAEIFDDIKIFIDELGRLVKIDYLDKNTINNHLLPFLANYHGIDLPNQFLSSTKEQYLNGSNLTLEKSTSSINLQEIQNSIWRRILTDITEIRKSRGTISSIKSVLRNVGINPNGPFKIKEYGGSNSFKLRDHYEKREKILACIDFNDYSDSSLTTSYLLDNQQNTVLTDESWSVEAIVKLKPNTKSVQSVCRVYTNGVDDVEQPTNNLLYNLIVKPNDNRNILKFNLSLFVKTTAESDLNELKINDLKFFPGNIWYLSFGIEKTDAGSKHFLRAAQINQDVKSEIYETTLNIPDEQENVLTNLVPEFNSNGAFITVGKTALSNSNGFDDQIGFLNNSLDPEIKTEEFYGKLIKLRFYQRALNTTETRAHSINLTSLGTDGLLQNLDINHTSYKDLKMNLEIDQLKTHTDDSGKLQIYDFSKNNLNALFECNQNAYNVIKKEKYFFNILAPKFESNIDENKVRIRSFNKHTNRELYNASTTPLYEILESETPADDKRIAVETSVVQALNDDIAVLFSSLDKFNNYIGSPELLFSREYRSLRNLRKIYFERLDDKIKIQKFFEFFKWFDDTIGDIIEDLIPFNSKYLGTNFVIENHALERPKYNYSYFDAYLGESDRSQGSVIYLQQFLCTLKKF